MDIAIIGCGPVGALLGNLLGAEGLSVDIYERERDVYPLPRAVHFDGEIMRLFQSAGLANEIKAFARPGTEGTHFVNGQGRTLVRRQHDDMASHNGWTASWYFHQPLLEGALRRGLARYPNVRVHLGHEVGSVDELGHRFVIGCDGARSLVRHAIGSRRIDLGLNQPWLVVDLLCDLESARVQAIPAYTLQVCDPARPMTAVNVGPARGGWRRRWEIMLMPGDDPAHLTDPEVFWPMIARWLGPEDARLERAAVYTFHSAVQEGWRKGRLLLAGDACHQTPPFLGQGMCAGLRDAANLSWKLGAVVRGEAPDSLLDSYEVERRPHVRAFIALAVDLGGILQETDRAKAAERDRSYDGSIRTYRYPQQQLGLGCRLDQPAPVGTIFPQPCLDDGRLMDEAIGRHFAIVGDAELLKGLRTSAVVLPGVGTEWLAEHGAKAAILRPDRYIFGVARTRDELLAATRRSPASFGLLWCEPSSS
ncbi:MAG: bifunctional 3-(3-hydroxy-phenyl)propionate/3-hydroxycinnamic acid hydroxylase [Alphaproteobacteria bacterium]|nr:bifunctional 3-(3-hydroxy-phenyl)propionate/3-hydroxycinnamic acid hydroxylase [Alphaproteobacteria bacterium]